ADTIHCAWDDPRPGGKKEPYPPRSARHEKMAAQFHAWADAKGFTSFVAPEYRSPTTANCNAGGVDMNAFIAKMLERGHELSHGYGKLKGRCFRVGHFGDHTPQALGEMLGIADEVLAKLRR